MRRLIAGVGAVLTAAVFAASAPAATKTVSVNDDTFAPAAVTVTKGSTVTWVWRGKDKHNVTVKSGPVRFASATQSKGSFSKRLTRAGLYRLYCTVHGSKMSMSVRVR